MLEAVHVGIGLLPFHSIDAKQHEQLVPLIDLVPEWQTDLWLVTHRDARRSAKI